MNWQKLLLPVAIWLKVGCLLSQFHFTVCCYFLSHIACWKCTLAGPSSMASPYTALWTCAKHFGKQLRNDVLHRPETWICCIFMSLLQHFIFLASFMQQFQSHFFHCVTLKTVSIPVKDLSFGQSATVHDVYMYLVVVYHEWKEVCRPWWPLRLKRIPSRI